MIQYAITNQDPKAFRAIRGESFIVLLPPAWTIPTGGIANKASRKRVGSPTERSTSYVVC